MKLPSKNQWKQFFGVLTKKEKIVFSFLSITFISSLIFLISNFYFTNTKIVPASGGNYIEGIVGSPRFINPLYADTSDIDKALTELTFSGLMKYNTKGEVVTELADSYKILENGKVYEFTLKDNLTWQDGETLNADDVVFTIKAIQNPEIKSPLRSIWLGINVEKVSDLTIRFTLKNESSIFLENCTLKIIPKHIWKDIPSTNIALSSINLKPVGSGPYQLKKINQEDDGSISSIEFEKNKNYYSSAYIDNLTFKFYNSEEELLQAYQNNKIDGFSLTDKEFPQNGKLIQFAIPRYFAVFLNLKEESLFENKNIRLAFNYATNKESILNKFYPDYGEIVNSPILPQIYNFEEPSIAYNYDIEKAKTLLDEEGFTINGDNLREKKKEPDLDFKFERTLVVGSQGNEVTELQKCLAKDSEIYPDGTVSGYFGSKTKEAIINFQEKYKEDVLEPFGLTSGTGSVRGKTREKLNEICFETEPETEPLSFSLYTVDQPRLTQIAKELKEQWESALNCEINIETFDLTTLERDVLRDREYDALLFGEMLSAIPDPFPFWHSTQNGAMGLNLVNYDNKDVDILLEANRKLLDETKRKEKLEEFQNLLMQDCPAIFLYNPNYPYFTTNKIQGVTESFIADPSQRFCDLENWYIKTKRIWK
jgi:ABC-type transport system substrate-binding protein